jgi:hypothetical protein
MWYRTPASLAILFLSTVGQEALVVMEATGVKGGMEDREVVHLFGV